MDENVTIKIPAKHWAALITVVLLAVGGGVGGVSIMDRELDQQQIRVTATEVATHAVDNALKGTASQREVDQLRDTVNRLINELTATNATMNQLVGELRRER